MVWDSTLEISKYFIIVWCNYTLLQRSFFEITESRITSRYAEIVSPIHLHESWIMKLTYHVTFSILQSYEKQNKFISWRIHDNNWYSLVVVLCLRMKWTNYLTQSLHPWLLCRVHENIYISRSDELEHETIKGYYIEVRKRLNCSNSNSNFFIQ